MRVNVRTGVVAGVCVVAAMTGARMLAQGGAAMPPVNQAPNPYQTIENHFKLPEGRAWGSTSAVEIGKDGKTIWVAERCSANSCWDAAKGQMSPLDTLLKFDTSGKLLLSAGKGLMVFPHGIHVDKDGNVWVTDGQDNLPRRRPGQAADAPMPPAPATIVGHQVHKFSPDGKLLMSLGKPGGNQPGQPADPASFYQPNDVITYPNGDILVAEGHGNAAPSTARLVRFDKNGKFLREFGKMGTGTDGEFMQPHGLAFDSKGRLFVADRSNNRIQILDAETYKTLDTWYQFSRLSGITIDKNDIIYGADSESGSVNPPHGAWMRGIRIGSARDGKITAFIPDPTSVGETFSMVDGKPVMKKADGSAGATGTLAAEGVAVDAAGNIYGAEVGPRAVKKYTRR
jgi:sugar lactone lactonase YvrE